RPRRPRRRSAASRGNYLPHRGRIIFAFGLLALKPMLLFPFIFGPMAWIMGSGDLREIREGRMDPEGESMTQAGKIMGMIGGILWGVLIFAYCGCVGCAVMLPALNRGGAPPRRF